jgi:multiple sugar transport system substrate-binding protein
MSKDARGSRLVKIAGAVLLTGAMVVVAGCSGSGGGDAEDSGDVTIEFAQWWEPELPDGAFRALMDTFEEENPGITVELVSGPYASTKEQLFAGAASGTMPDVVGLDGAWVNDFASQGVIADLTALMAEVGYDDSELASQIQVDGATYMIPVVNFVYPLFTNDALLEEAGVAAPPATRSEFEEAAKAITAGGEASGWALPLSLEAPNGVQNDVMSWAWASGGTMLADGQPDVTNDDVRGVVEYIQGLWDEGVIAPGSFTMKEQDKVEEFTNGRVGMMIDSLSHINLIRETNPELEFSISAIPAEDGFDGERGIPYASWGIGVAENSEHKDAAFKLVEYLMSTDVNSELSTIANAFPGNVNSAPDLEGKDELFTTAFEIYQAGYPANEFTGLPVAEELMRQFGEQFQALLDGQQSVDEMLETVQDEWAAEF